MSAGTALIQGLANGNVSSAVANASAPYIASAIGKHIEHDAGKLAAHAIANVALALAKDENALSQAAGAVTAEAMGMLSQELYKKKPSRLTEEEKSTVSAFATLAGGIAGGLAGGSLSDGMNAAIAGKTTVENNYLSDKDITTFTEKYVNAKTDAEREQLLSSTKKLDVEQQARALATGIPVKEQKAELGKLKALAASPDCNAQCQGLVAYSISELEPVANNTELHKDNLNKAVLAGVIFGLTVEKSAANNPISSLTREQRLLIERAEIVTTAKGIQNPFPRDLNEKVLWNGVKANPSAGEVLKGMNKDQRFPASAGFQKMQVTHELPDGSNITIHYQYNLNTGKAYDMKIVTPQTNPLQPGPSLKGK